MKNFKKVLALVLVLASLLGLATMAGAATEYKDADKINADYTEAIKVLDLIETMQGYPDGNFKPTATITREEAAKVIAIFDNKDAPTTPPSTPLPMKRVVGASPMLATAIAQASSPA